ncbi:DNA/RNA helicase, superfamily II, SNF2 family (plasmid) [Thermobacillus composti KWC4]|jgi:SNF2 family DNA or RNA helicase|uniref:DNA/RNA helicase, superfamily II, SNF2 family n=1 Tax=Thermobacillus composti (strain DSM 18247 / JCM 13945 / KWC4) TaxID=717605 RepID=L0EK59_THECK|nr:DEAD/DEAH box helicase [Thermobacillus composti]AGA60079.1 DNA/RNA helicase, superfamily II, SNF2 family [Thermobacillus composti KWC4]
MSVGTAPHLQAPAYLQRPVFSGHYYGKLLYEARTDSWIIRGEPCVVMMAKKLFPGSSGRHAGEARFKRNKRTNGDLNWLMLRYPLQIENPDVWESDYSETIEHVMKRQRIAASPYKSEPHPVIFKGQLGDFQKEGLAFLQHNAPTLLADEMGLGKTVQALAWISTINRFPGIIVCTKNIVRQWAREIRKFIEPVAAVEGQLSLFPELDMVHIINGLSPYQLPPAQFYIIHYGLLRGWKRVLPEYNFQFLVFDEIQELRHRGTEKYSAASLLAESVQNRIGMSGTPVYGRGGEIWNVMNIIEMNCLGDWDYFTREWCEGYGTDVVRDPEQLGEYLRREGLMLRRTKQQVLDELPPKRRIVHEIDYDESLFQKSISLALNLLQEFDSTDDYLKRGRLKQRIGEETRQATGIAKAPFVASFVRMLLEAGETVVLYGWHHAVYDIWMEELKDFNPVRITGTETDNQKEESKKKFMNGETRLLIISIRAAAGLDGLQHNAHINVFGELDWSPGVCSQAEDRLHRMGQRDSVLSYYLVSGAGSDEAMLDALGFKTAQFVGIMGDKVETEEDRAEAQKEAGKHLEKVIEKLRTMKK